MRIHRRTPGTGWPWLPPAGPALLLAAILAGPCLAGGRPVAAQLDSLLAAGRTEEAVRRAEALLASGELAAPEAADVQQRLCVANLELGRPAAALPACEAAVLALPGEPVNHRNLAACLMALGRLGRAIGEYQQALALGPVPVDWRLEYANALLDLGARRDALREIERAAADCGQCLAADSARVRYHLAVSDPGGAVAPLQRLYAASGDPAWRDRLVRALWQAGRHEDLSRFADELATAGLTPVELRLILQADREVGRGDRARRWAPGGAESAQLPAGIVGDASFWALVAEICLATGAPQPALVAIDAAIAREPRRAAWHQNRAAILLELGRRAEAEAALDRARELGGGPHGGGEP